MESYKNIYILIATFVIVVLSLDKCKVDSLDEHISSEVMASKVKVDSVRTHYEQHIDSTLIWVHHSYTEIPEKEQNDVSTPSSSFLNNSSHEDRMDLSDTSELFNRPNTFYYGKSDSSLSYTIKVISDIKPVKVEMEYDILKLMVKDSIYVRDSVNIKQVDKVRVNQLYYGIEAIVHPGLRGMFAGVDLVSKKGWQFEAAIGLANMNNLPEPMIKVGVKKLLTFRKK